jgi:hypothetical protein
MPKSFPARAAAGFRPHRKLLEGGLGALAGKEERAGERDLQRKIAELERALGRKTYELEIAAKQCGAGSEGARRG